MQLTWNDAGERTFEVGVDRGVLYVDGEGIPWNGLISVSKTPSGGDITPYYYDGIKYLDHVENEDYEATIEAFTYPEKFAECDGTKPVGHGLFAGHQAKKTFGLVYRTRIGNDLSGTDYGYKIHVVYNATATPQEQTHNTISDEIDPLNFSWRIFAKPARFRGYKPTAYFVINSRDTPFELIQRIEDILYGTLNNTPRLPSVAELTFLFKEYRASIFDAGWLTDEYFRTIDAGRIPEEQIITIDANEEGFDYDFDTVDAGPPPPDPSIAYLDGGAP